MLFAATLAGCDRTPSPGPAKPGGGKIEVLATVYPLAEMVQRVGGPAVNVQWLVEGNAHPEDFSPTAEVQQRPNRAALVVTGGPWDAWTGASLGSEAREARVVEAERMPSARGADPSAYLWLDPTVVREMVEAVRVKLTVLDPSREAEFRANAAAYLSDLDAVARAWEPTRAKVRGRTLLAVRPVWDAFAKRHGFTIVAPVSGATDAKLSAGDFKTLARFAKENGGLRTILVDVGTPLAVRQQIEERTGLRAVTIDALGTSAPDGRSTLAKVLQYDLEQIQKAVE